MATPFSVGVAGTVVCVDADAEGDGAAAADEAPAGAADGALVAGGVHETSPPALLPVSASTSNSTVP